MEVDADGSSEEWVLSVEDSVGVGPDMSERQTGWELDLLESS